MGRGGWQKGGARESGYYWRGSWPARPSKEKQVDVKFPTYDSMTVAQQGKGAGKAEDFSADETTDSLVCIIQEGLNATRKAEQKVRSLSQQKQKREGQWNAYLDALRKSHLKEHDKYGKEMARINEDLQTALQAQEDARAMLRTLHTRDQPDAQAVAPDAWEKMTSAWQRERHEEQDSAAVLRRAWGDAPALAEPPVPVGQRRLTPEVLAFLAQCGISPQTIPVLLQTPSILVWHQPCRLFRHLRWSNAGPTMRCHQDRLYQHLSGSTRSLGLCQAGYGPPLAGGVTATGSEVSRPDSTAPGEGGPQALKEQAGDLTKKPRQSVKALPTGVAHTASPKAPGLCRQVGSETCCRAGSAPRAAGRACESGAIYDTTRGATGRDTRRLRRRPDGRGATGPYGLGVIPLVGTWSRAPHLNLCPRLAGLLPFGQEALCFGDGLDDHCSGFQGAADRRVTVGENVQRSFHFQSSCPGFFQTVCVMCRCSSEDPCPCQPLEPFRGRDTHDPSKVWIWDFCACLGPCFCQSQVRPMHPNLMPLQVLRWWQPWYGLRPPISSRRCANLKGCHGVCAQPLWVCGMNPFSVAVH